jgi:hypothetical protein
MGNEHAMVKIVELLHISGNSIPETISFGYSIAYFALCTGEPASDIFP